MRRCLLIAAPLLIVVSLPSCHRPKQYETNVEIKRIAAVQAHEPGAASSMDVEVSFLECPGDQIEVVRGGVEFAKCIQSKQTREGGRVGVKVMHRWDPEGHYEHDIVEVNGCARPFDPNDQDSFKIIRECSDWVVNGVPVGFQCQYAEKEQLVKKCPWFRRH